MSYTQQQLADLYEKAVSAEAAGEPINCKLPEVMCRLAPESDVIEVNRLISNLKALPQKYTTSHIALEDVLEVINQLRAKP